MGSFTAVTTVVSAGIQPVFPILPFLKFDPAEVFSVLAFLVFGPIPALITATVHWIFLTASAGTPLGPAVKYAAVLSTLGGLWLGSRLYRGFSARYHHLALALCLMLAMATLTRVVVLLVVNYFVFTYVGPVIFGFQYLQFGQQTLQQTLGLQFASTWDVLMAMLLYTSIYNALQTLFSVVVPFMIFTPLSLKVPEIASGHPWISRFTTQT